MSDAPRRRATDPPMCKICEHAHPFGTPHIWSGRAAKAPPAATPVARRADAPKLVEQALAKAVAVVASPPKTKRKNGRKRK